MSVEDRMAGLAAVSADFGDTGDITPMRPRDGEAVINCKKIREFLNKSGLKEKALVELTGVQRNPIRRMKGLATGGKLLDFAVVKIENANLLLEGLRKAGVHSVPTLEYLSYVPIGLSKQNTDYLESIAIIGDANGITIENHAPDIALKTNALPWRTRGCPEPC